MRSQAYGAYNWQGVLLAPGDIYQGSGALIDHLHVITGPSDFHFWMLENMQKLDSLQLPTKSHHSRELSNN